VKKWWINFSFLYLLSFIVITMPAVKAEERVGFSVQAELPENQRDQRVSYFNLQVEPNQEQTLNITIYNHENEEITVQGDIHNASTNSNGLVVYEEQEEIDPSLENPMTELVSLEASEWTIPAGESLTVTAALEVLEEEFDGIKLGGFHFIKALSEEEMENAGTIQNQYAYVIAIQLSQNDDEVMPNLNFINVKPGLVNHRTAIITEIQNDQPILMGDLAIEAQVYRENENEPLGEAQLSDAMMAPNSTMEFVMDWNNRRLEVGKYRLEMIADDGQESWEWQEAFEISEESEELNEEAVVLEAEENNNWLYIINIITLILFIIVLLIYIRKLKRNKE